MRIAVVSRYWPSNERSGVTLAAAAHVKILAAAGHDVSIIGSVDTVLDEHLPVSARYHVAARGSGSLYSPARLSREHLRKVIETLSPELVIVEAWQTALTDTTIDVASDAHVPLLMVSHGASVHPFGPGPLEHLRALAWRHYRSITLPRLISRLNVLTTLDESSTSDRFFDRDLARRMGIPVVPLANSAVNWSPGFIERERRRPQILVIGYFSRIKNQMAALEVCAALPQHLHMRFVGPRVGGYYERCVGHARELGLESRVTFAEDAECDVADEIAGSLVVLSTSITEALPLTLIEAMAAGTPFVATPVGAVPSLQGGVLAADRMQQTAAVRTLAEESSEWCRCSEAGRRQFFRDFSRERVAAQLMHAIDIARAPLLRRRWAPAGIASHSGTEQ